MSWGQKLRSWASGESSSVEEAGLPQLCLDLDREAARLQRHAELAPNEAAEVELRRLSTSQSAIVIKLREALHLAPSPVAEGDPPAALNHWARLVRDLEHMRSQRDRLFDAAKEVDADDPALGETLDGLGREIEAHLLRLRALIARADAHSLN
jgi:hypothetical protein